VVFCCIFSVLYSHLPQLQNQAGGANNGNVFPSHSTAQSSLSISSGPGALTLEALNTELDRVKSDRNELEEKVRVYEEDLENKNVQITQLTSQNELLAEKHKEIVEELETANSTIQKLAEKQQSSAKVTEAVDKLACFAFEQDDVDLINAEWEAKLSNKNKEINRLENELLVANHKLDSLELTIKSFKSDLRSEKACHENKILEMSACLKVRTNKIHTNVLFSGERLNGSIKSNL